MQAQGFKEFTGSPDSQEPVSDHRRGGLARSHGAANPVHGDPDVKVAGQIS